MERLVDWHIRATLQKGPALHAGQHAFQAGKSTESALHHLVTQLEIALEAKDTALCAFLDVEGAFSNVSFSAVNDALRRKNVPPAVARWIGQILSQREVFSTRGAATVCAEVRRGCPQGGVSSPLIWSIVIDDLLTRLTEMGYYVQAYADDLVILVRGTVQGVISDLMQRALTMTSKWCRDRSLGVNPLKTQIVRFTNKQKLDTLPELCLDGQPLQLSEIVKYLGIWLDSKLTWRKQLEEAVNRARAVFWTLKGCFGSSWGLPPQTLRWLYVTVMRPTLAYGSVVWWRRAQLLKSQTDLSKFQRLLGIAATGAIRSTPSKALDVLLDLPPLHLYLENEAWKARRRLVLAGILCGKRSGRGHAGAELEKVCPEVEMPCDRTVKELLFDTFDAPVFPTREDWADGKVPYESTNSVVWYTDGSLLNGMAGAGLFCNALDVAQAVPLGRYATVFQAEVMAIKEALECCLSNQVKDKTIIICSDSQAALRALARPEVTSCLVKECKLLGRRVKSRNNIRLVWVPGHTGVEGNEKADELAREGSGATPFGPEPILPVSWATINGLIEHDLKSKNVTLWKDSTGMKHSKGCVDVPSARRTRELLARGRGAARLVVAMLTGHGPFKAHLAKMGVGPQDTACRFCEEEEESGWHVLMDCPALWRQRLETLGFALNNNRQQTADLRPGAVHRFCQAINLQY